MRNEKEELYYNITEIPHVRVTERSKNVKERKPHRYFGYCTIKIVPKHRWKRLFNFAIVLWRDGLINSLPRYAGTWDGRVVRGQSIVRFTGTPVRLRAAAGVEIATLRPGICVCACVCVYSLARSVPAWPVATLVLWPGYLRSYIPLPRIPSCLSRLSLSRTYSRPFCTETRRCHSNIWFTVPLNRMPPAPPFFHGKPSPPRPNSCRGRNRVRALRHRISPYPSFLGLHIWIRLDRLQRNRDCLFFFSFSKWLSVVILVEIFHEIFSETLSAILSLALFTYTDTKWCLACIEERWSLLFVQAFLSFAWNLSIFHLVYIFG